MRAGWGMAGGIVAAGVVLASGGIATAQPIAPGNAWATIAQLEDAGYDVNVDRVGSAPYEDCIVTSVRNPQDITRTFWVGKGKDRERVTVVVRRTITISLNCDV
ncbi:MAG TPA: hypothetical protein VF328_27095 [Mycobacterium sp.]